MNDTFLMGCHLSVAHGFAAMARTAVRIDANVIQCFIRNPRGGQMRAIDAADIAEYRRIAAEHGFAPLIVHAPYTVNPCSDKPETRELARRFFTEELDRLELIPGSLYNFHPGSHVGQGVEEGIRLIVELLNAVMPHAKSTTVLLETMAGKGSEVGRTFEELREIMDRAEQGDRLGVTLDTCHISDGGYDVVGKLDAVLDLFGKQRHHTENLEQGIADCFMEKGMTADFMPRITNHVDDFRIFLRGIPGKEERGLDIVFFQQIKNQRRSMLEPFIE